jgi:hypothetical protein
LRKSDPAVGFGGVEGRGRVVREGGHCGGGILDHVGVVSRCRVVWESGRGPAGCILVVIV